MPNERGGPNKQANNSTSTKGITGVSYNYAMHVSCKLMNFMQFFISRVFLLRQLWIINYYFKSSSNDLSNEDINTGVSREMIVHFGILIHVSS